MYINCIVCVRAYNEPYWKLHHKNKMVAIVVRGL